MKKLYKFSDFLFNREDRFKPREAEKFGFKRIDKINFAGDIFLSDKNSNTDMILVKSGDLVISGINVEKGAVAVYEGKDDVLATIHYSSYQYDPKIIDIEYLKLFVKSPQFRKLIISATNGGIKTEIKPKHLLPLEILLPEVSEQRIVVSKINEALMTNKFLLEFQTSQINDANILRQSILRDAIQGKLVPQDLEDEPAEKLLEKIKIEKEKLIKEGKLRKEKPLPLIKPDEIPFELPNGWMWSRLKEIGITQTGTTPPTGERKYFGDKYPFIKPADITGKSINYYNEGLSESGVKKGVLIRQDSVMMVCIGGSIGKCFFTDRECSCNQQLNTVSPLGNIPSLFIYRLLSTDYFQERVKLDATGSATPIINRGKWENILIPIPPLSEQNRIVIKIESLMKICDEQEKNITEAKENINKLNQAILREMFN